MATWNNCCVRSLSNMANIVDSYTKYPDVAQFLRSLKDLSVEDANDKIDPWYALFSEWYDDLKGIGETGAREIFFKAQYEISINGGDHHGETPHSRFWICMYSQVKKLYDSEMKP